jgi:hypothetical protein
MVSDEETLAVFRKYPMRNKLAEPVVLHRRSPVEVTERTPASHKLELADDEQIHVRRLDTAGKPR